LILFAYSEPSSRLTCSFYLSSIEFLMQPTKTKKVAILGGSGVGKSSILLRFVNNDFDPNIVSTFGAAFLDKNYDYNGILYKFQIWDTAGQEKYAPLAAHLYYRDANIVLLVYDITNEESFKALKDWHKEVLDKGPKDILIGVVGNKSDLIEKEQVSLEEGSEYAKSIKAFYKQTSAKENKGITDLFERVCEEVEKREASAFPSMKDSIKIGNKKTKDGDNDEPRKKKCC